MKVQLIKNFDHRCISIPNMPKRTFRALQRGDNIEVSDALMDWLCQHEYVRVVKEKKPIIIIKETE